MKRLPSLFRRAAVAAALGFAAMSAASASMPIGAAYASGPGSDDDDAPDFDDWDFDDYDDDNSGHGGGDNDFDDDDNSGHGDNDDDREADDDHSGRGDRSDEDRSDNAGAATDEIIYSVEYDSHGDEYAPGEIVFVGSPRDLNVATRAGFRTLRSLSLSSGGVMARLKLPPGVNMNQGLASLRESIPAALLTPNNIYRSAQGAVRRSVSVPVDTSSRLLGMIGIIDTGVNAASLPASGALLSQRAFAGARPIPREHGSMVASIAMTRGVGVHVADVFGHSADGALAASAERIAAAIDWMIENRVAVVNISVEGPNNAILNEMVQRAARRGHIIVAAAGNGGPAARPTYPAAFDGVLAVTAIDDTDRPYIRANRGAYIDFAAHGVDLDVSVGDAVARVSGTSFAAPIIAAEAALQLPAPSPAGAEEVLRRLRERADDLGAPGRDNVFGWGALRN